MSGKREYKPEKVPRKKKTADRETPPRYEGWKRVLYYAYIALTILSAVIVVGYIAWNLFSAAPKLPTVDPNDTDSPGGRRGAEPMVTTTVDQSGVPIEIEIPGLSADRKKEFYTFLLVGQDQKDGGGGLTDTMILVAYDVPNQKLSLLSLPRDTYVNYRGSTILLNAVYNWAGGGENGIKRLKQEVGELTGVTPDYYVMIQWEALGELVDAIDGVYFDVPQDMRYKDPLQNLVINLNKGYQLLDGSKAMQLVRFRYGYADGDIGRIRVQQAFLKETIKKCLQPSVLLPNLGEYIGIFQKNVSTDLKEGEIAYFVKSAVGGLNMDNVSFATLPFKGAGDEHLLPVGSQIVKVINESFNPYLTDIQLYELDLVDHIVRHTPSPSPSVSPENSARPSGSPRPGNSESPEPTGSEDPVPPPSASAESPEPNPTAAASEPPAQPTQSTQSEEDPVLPPGTFG